MIKAYLCDFEDSFTYNIYSELLELDFIDKIEIVEKEGIAVFFSELAKQDSHSQVLVVLGPGPGHPKQYSFLMENLKQALGKKNIILFGICLGHQLISLSLGFQIKSAKTPLHGKVEHIKLAPILAKNLGLASDLYVQRYNSLVPIYHDKHCERVEHFYQINNELLIVMGENFLAYQFHPESVGTTCPSSFFKTLKRFLI